MRSTKLDEFAVFARRRAALDQHQVVAVDQLSFVDIAERRFDVG
jgi:hypothetical protein